MDSEDWREIAEITRSRMGERAMSLIDAVDEEMVEKAELFTRAARLLASHLAEAGVDFSQCRLWMIGVLLAALQPDD